MCRVQLNVLWGKRRSVTYNTDRENEVIKRSVRRDVLFCFVFSFTGPNVPRFTLHKTSSGKSQMYLFAVQLPLSPFFADFPCQMLISFLLAVVLCIISP